MKKILFSFLIFLFALPLFCEIRLGIDFGTKIDVSQQTKDEYIPYDSIQIIVPKIEISVYKSFEIVSEYEFSFFKDTQFNYLSSVFILGIQNSFKLPSLFYLRPYLKFSLFGTTTNVNIDGRPFFELGTSVVKSFPLKKDSLQLYGDIAWRKEFSSISMMVFDIGLSYSFKTN